MHKHIVKAIKSGSIAEELDIMIGDELLTMNGKEIEDVLDYTFLEKDEEVEIVLYRSSTNEEWEFFIEKEEAEEIGLEFDSGLEFESGLMDDYKSCHNKCVFCFIDQLPEGMRETMYFKDDDARLSFLQGNYITLTNMKEKDFNRIVDYRLAPINLSIHTMNMELRAQMLHNRFAGRLIGYMDKLNDADIRMNGQIVLCKGINDGSELEYSIQEMMKYHPNLQSVSIVPVGLTKYRDHLEKLDPFECEDALEVINLVKKYQKIMMEKCGKHFIHAGDEFYFLAGEDVPKEETYDGYLQYENGVGMTRLLIDEFNQCYNEFDFNKFDRQLIHHKTVTIITGELIAPVIQELSEQFNELPFNPPTVMISAIHNHFFGPRITVSGLVTGNDIINHFKD